MRAIQWERGGSDTKGKWGTELQDSRGVHGLLGGLKHLHDSFNALHTETSLRITNVQLGKGMSGTGDKGMSERRDDVPGPVGYQTWT